MNRNRKIAVGVVVIGIALLYGLVGYHPASAGTAAPFDDAEPNGSYTSHMSLSTNGNHFVTYDIRTDEPDGQLLLTAAFENVTYTTYWHQNRSVTRSKPATRTQYEQMLHLSADERLVRQDNESMTAVVVDTDEDPPGGGRSLLLSVLEYPEYEHTGTTTYDSRAVDVYTAQSGWHNTHNFASGRTAYNVESASGVLYVDADTEQLLYSNVTFQFVRAATWGEYLVTKYVRGESPTTSIDVAVDPGATNVTRPGWAPAQSE
ncbi:hypothetical protein [Halolamina sediminis]|uniref:hypothetical protein n=1 Tax=Halolamina sediminis TaxID=1480675 RepID=UPI0006B69F93|nr:hypothetical protein [Halolamina sediminis]